MNFENCSELTTGEQRILNRFSADIRQEYEPSFEYHGWDSHIITGLHRIEALKPYCAERDIPINWFLVSAAYLGHDARLTQTMLDPSLLTGYDYAEELSAEITHQMLKGYGVGKTLLSKTDYIILGTNPSFPCDTLEAKAHCRVDIGNTGDEFEVFLSNFVRIILERNSVKDLLTNPMHVVDNSCDFINLYLRRSELSLGPEDDFPSRVEQNLNQIRSMGAQAVRSAFLSRLRLPQKTS